MKVMTSFRLFTSDRTVCFPPRTGKLFIRETVCQRHFHFLLVWCWPDLHSQIPWLQLVYLVCLILVIAVSHESPLYPRGMMYLDVAMFRLHFKKCLLSLSYHQSPHRNTLTATFLECHVRQAGCARNGGSCVGKSYHSPDCSFPLIVSQPVTSKTHFE